jgi:hypothetical protein
MTIQKIAQELFDSLSVDGKRYIYHLPEHEIPILCLGLGMTIQTQYLQGKLKPEDATSDNPEYIVLEIIQVMWKIAKSESEKTE